MGHYEGVHIHSVGIDSSQRFIRDFHLNRNGSIRLDEVTGSHTAERDVIYQHLIIFHTVFFKSCFRFRITAGMSRNGYDGQFDFFCESTFGRSRCYDNAIQFLDQGLSKELFDLFQRFLQKFLFCKLFFQKFPFHEFFFRKFLFCELFRSSFPFLSDRI